MNKTQALIKLYRFALDHEIELKDIRIMSSGAIMFHDLIDEVNDIDIVIEGKYDIEVVTANGGFTPVAEIENLFTGNDMDIFFVEKDEVHADVNEELGFKVTSISDVLIWKVDMGRDKDIPHIKILRNHLLGKLSYFGLNFKEIEAFNRATELLRSKEKKHHVEKESSYGSARFIKERLEELLKSKGEVIIINNEQFSDAMGSGMNKGNTYEHETEDTTQNKTTFAIENSNRGKNGKGKHNR